VSHFIEWLESQNAKDTKVRAVLRRSLAFEPGRHVKAFPYVEPFLKEDENGWRREVHYLVAGLWAAHWREGRNGEAQSLGRACAHHQNHSGSASTEARFVALLDADRDQVPHRLRQMVTLLGEENLDFGELLKGLLYWEDEQKRTQNHWAQDFYRNLASASPTTPNPEERP